MPRRASPCGDLPPRVNELGGGDASKQQRIVRGAKPNRGRSEPMCDRRHYSRVRKFASEGRAFARELGIRTTLPPDDGLGREVSRQRPPIFVIARGFSRMRRTRQRMRDVRDRSRFMAVSMGCARLATRRTRSILSARDTTWVETDIERSRLETLPEPLAQHAGSGDVRALHPARRARQCALEVRRARIDERKRWRFMSRPCGRAFPWSACLPSACLTVTSVRGSPRVWRCESRRL
jgi:hypothetical protein